MSEFVRISSIWFEVLPFQQFSTFFDIMLGPWTEFIDAMFADWYAVFAGNALIIAFIDGIISVLKLFPFGQIPTVAILFGAFIFIVLGLHTLKLIVEALPIL